MCLLWNVITFKKSDKAGISLIKATSDNSRKSSKAVLESPKKSMKCTISQAPKLWFISEV